MNPETIFDTWYDKVYSFILFRVGSRPDAEDIASDVFVSVVEKMHTYDPDKGAVSTWLFAITINKVRMFLRRPRLFTAEDDGCEAAGQMDVLGEIIQKEDYKALHGAICRLDEKHREVILLKYFASMTSREIAQAAGLSVENVDVSLHRARKKIKNFLEDCKVSVSGAYKGAERKI